MDKLKGARMRKLIIFIILVFNIQAQVNLAYSINTTHINPFNDDYKFYEDNQVITLEREKNNELIGFTHFTNSFGNESMAIYIGKVYDKNNKGFGFITRTGICKGYNKVEYLKSETVKNLYWVFNMPNVLYEDYSLFATVGIEYKFNKEVALDINLLANAVVTSLKLSF